MQYEALNKDKINKNHYKEYLAMIGDNLQSLSTTKQHDMKTATHQDPLTASARLQGGMSDKILISNAEHSKILSQQTAFYESAVEIVRQELVQYGMVVSRIEALTANEKSCLVAIIAYASGF